MILVTGPLYSGKSAFAEHLLKENPVLQGRICRDAQILAVDAPDLPSLADQLAAEYDIVIITEVGGGVVPTDPAQRKAREAAGRLGCLLAERAACVVRVLCGVPLVLKGELPQ